MCVYVCVCVFYSRVHSFRLRKAIKKNDVESYRRLQQLKGEFNRARVLLQLVLERERLKQANIEIQREIFEQSLYECSEDAGQPR